MCACTYLCVCDCVHKSMKRNCVCENVCENIMNECLCMFGQMYEYIHIHMYIYVTSYVRILQ